MNRIVPFLNGIRSDFFKLLPMREDADNGLENHLDEYINNLIVTVEGASITFNELEESKPFLYIVNNLNYISRHLDLDFNHWRKIILTSTSSLTSLIKELNGGKDYGRKIN